MAEYGFVRDDEAEAEAEADADDAKDDGAAGARPAPDADAAAVAVDLGRCCCSVLAADNDGGDAERMLAESWNCA